MNRAPLTNVLLLALLAPFGCEMLTGLHRPEPAPDAQSDAALPDGQVGVEPPLACEARLPARPDGGAGSDLTIELVFNYFDTATTPAPRAAVELCPTSGFNLDEQCPAFAGSPSPCRTRCGDAGAHQGVDNVGGAYYADIRQRIPAAATSDALDPEHGLEHGGSNVMLRLVHYNGLPDDHEVELQIFALSGVASDTRPLADAMAPDGAPLDPTSWRRAWDRSSLREWYIDPSTVASTLTLSPLNTGTGYVANHVLVAHAPIFPIAIATVPVDIEHATVAGELRNANGRWSIVRGRLGGELRLATMLSAFQSFAGRDPSVCTSLDAVRATGLCEMPDRGNGAACDALSVGVSFTMVEGRLGALRRPPPPAVPCTQEICP